MVPRQNLKHSQQLVGVLGTEGQPELLWYLMDGSHDLAGLLVQDVRAPVRVEQVQLPDQPVVLSQEERVQRNHS